MSYTSTVDIGSPLNTSHPLARGMELWWLALPHLAKGYTWRDISGRNRHGTISDGGANNQAGVYEGWFPTAGYAPAPAAFKFNKANVSTSSTIISTSAIPCISSGSTAFTMSFWYRPIPLQFGGYSAVYLYSTDSSASAGVRLEAFNPTGGNIYYPGSGFVTVVQLGSGAAFPYSDWCSLTLVYDGTKSTDATKFCLYGNGQQILLASFPIGVTSALSGNGNGFLRVGAPGSGDFFTGSSIVHNRALGANEVLALHKEGAAGFPFMLNRVRRKAKVAAVATGNRRRRVIIGGAA